MSRPFQFCMPTQKPSAWHAAAASIVLIAIFAHTAAADAPRANDQKSIPTSSEIAPATSSVVSADAEIIPRKPPRTASNTRSTQTASPSGGWLRMVQPVAVVFGVMALLTWAGRKWLPQARQASNAQSVIRVLARQHLSSKQSLCLVKLGPKVVLLGVTPEHIGSVLEIRDPDEAASLVAAVESSRGRSFTKTMATFTESTKQNEPEDSSSYEPVANDANEQIRDMVRRVRALGAASHARAGSKLPVAPSGRTG